MYVRLSFENWLAALYSFADFFTLFGVPLAGDYYWSKRRE